MKDPIQVSSEADRRRREQDIMRAATPKDYGMIRYTADAPQAGAQTNEPEKKGSAVDTASSRHAPKTVHGRTVKRRIKYRVLFADAFSGTPKSSETHSYDIAHDAYFQRAKIEHALRDSRRTQQHGPTSAPTPVG